MTRNYDPERSLFQNHSPNKRKALTPEEREARFTQSKKNALILVLIGVIGVAVGLVCIGFYQVTGIPSIVNNVVGVLGLYGGIIALFAALIVRIVAGIRR